MKKLNIDCEGLSPLWWLYVPILLMIVQILIEMTLPIDLLSLLHSEVGPHEGIEALTLGAAFVTGLLILCQIDWRMQRWLGLWVLLATLCCFYVGGEEISWGQHLVKWSTPEFWQHYNDQGETNLHNTSAWLDQKPRLLLLIGTITGGLLIPALRRFRPDLLPEKFAIIYPPACLGLIAFLILAVHITDEIDERLKSIIIFVRASEIEELYMFYFVLLYLINLKRRIAQNQRAPLA